MRFPPCGRTGSAVRNRDACVQSPQAPARSFTMAGWLLWQNSADNAEDAISTVPAPELQRSWMTEHCRLEHEPREIDLFHRHCGEFLPYAQRHHAVVADVAHLLLKENYVLDFVQVGLLHFPFRSPPPSCNPPWA